MFSRRSVVGTVGVARYGVIHLPSRETVLIRVVFATSRLKIVGAGAPSVSRRSEQQGVLPSVALSGQKAVEL